MAKKLYEESDIQGIAEAIREKNGESTKYKTRDMAAVRAIPTGGGGFDMSVEPNQVKILIRIPKWNKRQMVRFANSKNGAECVVDWGDGIVEIFSASTELEYADQREHVYSESGLYIISITANEGTLIIGGINGISTVSENQLITGEYHNNNTTLRIAFASRVVEISAGDNVNAESSLCNVRMCHITRPFNFNSLQGTGIAEAYIPESLDVIPSYFAARAVIEYISFPETIKEIKNNAFDGCSTTSVFDFTKIKLNDDGSFPIVLSATNVFRGIKGYIVFETEEIANAAKEATNWATYAANIKHRGEVSW